MIAYLDTSVVLRVILSQPQSLREWDDLELGVASRLLQVECLRTIDRFWHQGELNEQEVEQKRSAVEVLLKRLVLLPPTEDIWRIASQPFPTIINSLDAIHLATAMTYRDQQPNDERPIFFATHDNQLATAAREMNFDVLGA